MSNQENNIKNPTAIPGKGLEHSEQATNAGKREAGFPGGEENAAGADAKDRLKRDKVGSQPVPSETLNQGEKKS